MVEESPTGTPGRPAADQADAGALQRLGVDNGRPCPGAVAVVGPQEEVRKVLEAVEAAVDAVPTVLRARGTESERHLGFAGLHDLLEPVLNRIPELDEARRAALLAALTLGDSAPAAPPDVMACCLAVRNLLTAAAQEAPLLMLVERTGMLDEPSRQVVTYVARRAEKTGVTAVLGWDADPPDLPEAIPIVRSDLVDDRPTFPTLVRRAIAAVRRGSARPALAAIEMASGQARRPTDRALVATLRGGALVLAGQTDEGSRLIHQHDGLLGIATPDEIALDAMAVVALALVWVEDYDDARSLADRVLSLTENDPRSSARIGALVVASIIDFGLGDWDASAEQAEAAMQSAVEGSGWLPGARSMATLVAACRGDERARELAEDVLSRSRTGPADTAVQSTRAAVGMLHLAKERPEAAVEVVEPLLTQVDRSQNPAPTLWEGCLVEAYAAVGRIDDARAVVDNLERRATGARHERGMSMALRLRAQLGDGAEPGELLDPALEMVSDPPLPWPMAQIHLAWGKRLLEVGHVEDAARHFRTADNIFRNLRSHAWSRRTSELLVRSTGVSPDEEADAATGTRVIRLLGRLESTVDTAGLRVTEPLPVGHVTTAVEIVVAAGGRLHTDQLIEELWPDTPPSLGRARLRNLLKRMRSVLGEVLARQGPLLVLAPEVSVDALEFEQLGRRALAAEPHDRDLAVDLARRALELDDGDFALDNLYETWAAAPREAVRRRRLDLLDLLVRSALSDGRFEEADRLVHQAFDLDPLDEDRCVEAAHRFLDAGRRGSALQLLDRAKTIAAELDLPPSPAATQLEQRLRS